MKTHDKVENRVSVVIPTYNNAATLSVTLDALLNQKSPASEIIIVDDCSDIPVGETLGSRYPQVTIIRHEKNQGVHIARNTGYEQVTGKYVFFLDADDIICPDFLLIMTNILERNNDIAASLGYFHTCTAEKSKAFLSDYRETAPTTKLLPRGEGLSLYLKKTGMLLPSFSVFRKAALENIKVDGHLFALDVWGNEDFHLFVRILANYPVIHVQNKMGVYMVRDDNISANQANVWKSRSVALDSLIKLAANIPFTRMEVGQLKKMRGGSARKYAKLLYLSGAKKEAKNHSKNEFRRSSDLKTLGFYILMFLGIRPR